MTANTLNLDKLAAEQAQDMLEKARAVQEVKKPVETTERLVTKALGVLQSQGVYACMLFLFSRTSDEAKIAKVVREQLIAALRSLPDFQEGNVLAQESKTQDILRFYVEKVTGNDLDTLLLVRDLYEQTLTYARYHAKALKEEK